MRAFELLREDMNNFAGKIPGPLPNGSKPLYYFKTEKGSEYIMFSGGELLRNKSEQGAGDTGLQPLSQKCIFVEDVGFLEMIQEFWQRKARVGKVPLTIRTQGNFMVLGIYYENKWQQCKLSHYDNTMIQKGKIQDRLIQTLYSRLPEVGYYVFDYDTDSSGKIISYHPGHKVTEVSSYSTTQGQK